MTKQPTEAADGTREGPLQHDVPRDEDHLLQPRPKARIVRKSDSEKTIKESNPS